MAAAPHDFQRIYLQFQSPWNLANETVHNWNNKFSLSGSLELNAADAEATALALAGPILALTSAKTSLIGWAYSPQGNPQSTFAGSYATGTHPGTASAYTPPIQHCQLEVAVLCRSLLPDKNSRGKSVYLRKWIHDVSSSQTDGNTIGTLAAESSLLNPWNLGAGPHNLVPVDPTGGKQGGPWTIEHHLFTHQLRRGHKRKKVASASSGPSLEDLIGLGLTAAQAAAFIARYFPK